MGTKLEIFECSVYIISVEIHCFRPKIIYSCFQMDNMNIVDITSFEVNEGKNRVKLFTGTQFIARISCLEAFQTCPIYIYFTNAQNQSICACGFDMSPLIVDAFKSSSPENNSPITYREKLFLQNRYDQQVGVGIFEFSCRHFSQDLSIIQNFVEEVKPAQETSVITEQPQLEENTRANAMVMARSTRRKYEMPIMKDLLVLTKKYQKSSNGLVDEVEVLENEVRMIEKRQNMILQKKNQEQRRKIDIHQPLIPDTSSTHTSDFSYFENSSDYSYNSIMNQTFKDVEKTCGRSFSHHKTHHNRHKEHHHHHHHKKEKNEPENEAKQENEVKQENQAQSSAKDQSSAKSSKISQSNFDAFMQRQNAATERRRSFIQLNESMSFTSQASQASSKKLQKQKPSSSQQQQPQPQQQQQQQHVKAPEIAQTQIVESQKQQKPSQEQPTAHTTKPKKTEKSDETSKQEQNQKRQEKQAKKEEKQDQSFSEITSPEEEIASSRISSARSAASSRSSRSSSHIEPVSTVETLEIPSDDSKSSVKSKSSAKSNKSKDSDTSRISASSRASNSSKTSRASNSSKTSRASNSSKVSSSSKVSKSSKKSVSSSHHSSFEAETIEEPTTSNIIDVEQSSHIDVESSQKLSFTGTQETLDIDDDDVVDVEQKSSTTTPSATATTTTATKNSASTKNKTKESKTSSGVEFSNDLSKNDTQNISPSDSEMNEKDEHSSFISKKSNSDEEYKKKNNLDDINLSELIDGLNDTSAGNSSIASDSKNDLGLDSELKNALGIESESIPGFESKKKEKKEKSPPPKPESEPEEKEEKEEIKPSIAKEQISELQSGIDIDDIFSD